MDNVNFKNAVGYGTWAVISVCALLVQYQLTGVSGLLWQCILLQLLGGAGIFLAIGSHEGSLPQRYAGLVLQALAAIALNFTMDQRFLAIYTIVLAAQLPQFLRLGWGLSCTCLIMVCYFCIWHFYWNSSAALIETLLWSTFHLFSLFFGHVLNREQEQKEQAIALNKELRGTQSLLQEAAKQDERLRIARDLHDRIGHQLTALSIQLDVLRRSCPQPQRQQAENSYTLAQELLQSIRSTVSDVRDNHSMDIAVALRALFEDLPGIEVQLDWPANVQMDSLQQAQALFYCVQEAITNTLKHTQATYLHIQARLVNGRIQASVKDNGQYPETLEPGNGFKGMAERMASINGKFSWAAGNPGLIIYLSAPLADQAL